MLSLSAQKFISDLSRDAYHFAKLRSNGAAAGRGRPSGGQDRNKVILTMDDLSLALGEHGVNAKKPDYCEVLPSFFVEMLMVQTSDPEFPRPRLGFFRYSHDLRHFQIDTFVVCIRSFMSLLIRNRTLGQIVTKDQNREYRMHV